MRRNGGGGRAEEVEEEGNGEEEEPGLGGRTGVIFTFVSVLLLFPCFLRHPVQYSPVQVFPAGSGWLALHQERRRQTLFPRFSSLLQKGFVA